MHIPGHIAIGLIQHRLFGDSKRCGPVTKSLLIASLFPDAVDKPIGYIFHLMPNGRHYTHNIFSVILLSGAVTLIWGKAAGYGWLVGHLGHLLADADSMLPWFFPVKQYSFEPGRLELQPARFFRELVFLGMVLVAFRRSR